MALASASPISATPAKPCRLLASVARLPSGGAFKPICSQACIVPSTTNASYWTVSQVQASRTSVVSYAKGKGKAASVDVDAPAKGKGGKGGKGGDDANVDVAKLEKEAKTDAEDRMKKALNILGDNFNTIRTGRANPAILDRIMVDYFGSPTPLKNVAAITVPDSSTLLLAPFDKSALKDIERAINESDLGINPNNDGERIRLNLPMLTQDRRKELTKQVAKMGEETKVAVRNVRKDVLQKVNKAGDAFAKDAKKSLEDAIQKTTDAYCKKVDDMVKAKSDDLMKV